MAQAKGSDYTCQVCGSEAELILEGLDTVSDVMKAGTKVCKDCGSEEEIVLTEHADDTVKAVTVALRREKEAYLFYTDAAKKTSSLRGKDMLTQLAAFELNHYKKILHLYHSLQKTGKWVPYAGQAEIGATRHLKETRDEKSTREDDINVLTMAIKKEEEAQALYNKMAEETEDPTGKEMFKKLAAEEEVHWRILSDQFYALSNQGFWLWGD